MEDGSVTFQNQRITKQNASQKESEDFSSETFELFEEAAVVPMKNVTGHHRRIKFDDEEEDTPR